MGILTAIQRVDNNPYFVIIGIDPPSKPSPRNENHIRQTFSSPDAKEVIIGKVGAQKLNKTIGDTITLVIRRITKLWESLKPVTCSRMGVSYMSLQNVQEIEEKKDKVTMIYAKIEKDANVDEVTSSIESKYGKDINTIASLEDLQSVDQGLNVIETASWAISLLAIVIGGIGVINTMIMSVYERTREIGVLKAVGWKDRRILSMILGESIVLTLAAGIVGIIMGLVAIQVLMVLGMSGFIQPVYSPEVFLRGLGVALIVGLIGGFYPAYRASRLPPTEALRYE